MAKTVEQGDKDANKVRWACQEIITASSTGFYGSITVKMENGKVVHLDKHESFKPPKNE